MDPSKLKAHLVASLSALPNVDPIHITTLISTPRRVNDLYPHTPNPPRCFQMDYFVTVGVEVDRVEGEVGVEVPGKQAGMDSSPSAKADQPVSSGSTGATTISPFAASDAVTAPAHLTPSAEPATPHPAKPEPKTHLLSAAIHAHLYLLPSLSHSILYISKVDSSSYGPATPLPLTRTLVASFIAHFLPPANRPTATLRVQLFARSQGQYLFPNSAESARKKGVSGGRLCGWWKGVYEEAVRMAVAGPAAGAGAGAGAGDAGDEGRKSGPGGAEGAEGAGGAGGAASAGSAEAVAEKDVQIQEDALGRDDQRAGPLTRLDTRDVRLSYLLPSYSAHEAHCLLGNAKVPLPPGISWTYQPPFHPSTTEPVTMRTADGASVHVNIADLIPSLEDDPKQRFLDELALNNKPAEHELGRSEPSEKASCPMSTGQATEDNEMTSNGAATGADGASHVAATAESDNTDSATMHANEKAQTRKASAHARNAKEDEMQRRADYAALARTSYAEYWERLGFRQECAQDTTGFFSCVVGATAHRTGGTTDRSASQHSAECDTVNNTSPQTAPPRTRTPSHPSLPPTRQPKADPPNRRFQLPPTIVERLHKALLNTDFINAHLAQDGSAFWMDSMRRIVQDEIGAEGLSACMGVVRAKDREMVMKSERERDKGEKRVGEVVTVLQPRKKKRT